MIGAPRLLARRRRRRGVQEVSSVRRERKLLPGRKRGRGRHGVMVARGDIARIALGDPVTDGQDEQVLALAIHPCIPMTVHQLVDDAGLDLRLVATSLLLPVCRIGLREGLGRELREHGRDERHMTAVRRPYPLACLRGDAGQRTGFASTDGHRVELEIPAAVRLEEDPLAIRRPTRVPVLLRGRSQLPRRARAIGQRDPNVAVGPVPGHVHDPDDVRNPTPIRRELGIGDPVHRQQVIDGHGPCGPGGRAQRGEGREGCEKDRARKQCLHDVEDGEARVGSRFNT